jgi:large subunit ribosomal protein L34e
MMKKVKIRTPGNRLIIRVRGKKPSTAKCAKCKKPLSGVPRLRPSQLRKLPKTKRRPTRPYGGYLCSSCMRELIKEKVRKEFEVM